MELDSVRVILQFMCVGSLAGVTYLRYTVLTRSKKTETTVRCCDPALSVLVVLVSRNVFHVVSALQSFAFIHILFWLIRSLIDPTFAVFIVCGPLQLVTHSSILSMNTVSKFLCSFTRMRRTES